MESKLFVVVFAAICCFSYTESSYFARRSILVRQRPGNDCLFVEITKKN